MALYYIVPVGGQPGNDGSAVLDSTCAQWAASPDKRATEVIEADISGNVIRRLPANECEDIARAYRRLAAS